MEANLSGLHAGKDKRQDEDPVDPKQCSALEFLPGIQSHKVKILVGGRYHLLIPLEKIDSVYQYSYTRFATG